MNYEPNHIRWKPGDIVIHDADAKKSAMLMVVIGVRYYDDHVCTRYVHRGNSNKEYCNHREVLHDPAQFGILNTGD